MISPFHRGGEDHDAYCSDGRGPCRLSCDAVFRGDEAGRRRTNLHSQAAVGGEEFTFSLADALKKGPVVLYFFPKAFTKAARPRRTTSPRRPSATRRPAPR